jgi:LysM repeat protein
MKKIQVLLLSIMSLSAFIAAGNTPQNKYIEQYASLAVEEMYRSGIPASITLAQGLLESRYGQSELAVKGNNHFGIKCHNNWSGKKMYHDDDLKGECFRKYPSPEHSYRDHSDFLRYRERYAFLFDLEITDYKSWAYGLKKAGYATDPQYPAKLIKLIEEYRLYEYDTPELKISKTGKKLVIPESPSRIGQTEKLTGQARADFHFNAARELYRQNGVPFVYSIEGETYESLAASNNLFLREILKFNDLDRTQILAPGTKVFLQPKKRQAVKGMDKHVVEEGESMRSIAQKYGVRLKNLYKLNCMADVDVPREGDIIKLRK